MKMGEIKRVFSLSKTVRKESVELDRMSGGALAAFFGASIVIGYIGGGLWWILAGMSVSLSLYRFLKTYLKYLPFFKRANIDNFDEVIGNLERVDQSSLPKKVKDQLNDNILSQLPSSLGSPKQLEHLNNNDNESAKQCQP